MTIESLISEDMGDKRDLRRLLVDEIEEYIREYMFLATGYYLVLEGEIRGKFGTNGNFTFFGGEHLVIERPSKEYRDLSEQGGISRITYGEDSHIIGEYLEFGFLGDDELVAKLNLEEKWEIYLKDNQIIFESSSSQLVLFPDGEEFPVMYVPQEGEVTQLRK
jgi:hypothetical protein